MPSVWKFAVVLVPLLAFGPVALGCEITSATIDFAGMGTRTAWYCKASEHEKLQAIELFKHTSCAPDLIRRAGSAVAAEALDFIPYWQTKSDAEVSGPILELHLTLKKTTSERGIEHRSGIRAMANGSRVVATPPPQPGRQPASPRELGMRFQIMDVAEFERDCPPTGCTEILAEMCPSSNQIAAKGILGLFFDPLVFVGSAD